MFFYSSLHSPPVYSLGGLESGSGGEPATVFNERPSYFRGFQTTEKFVTLLLADLNVRKCRARYTVEVSKGVAMEYVEISSSSQMQLHGCRVNRGLSEYMQF